MKIFSDLREQLLRIVEAVVVHTPSSFTFAGVASNGLAPPMMGLQLDAGAPPLMGELVSMLYEHCYCTPFCGEVKSYEAVSTAPDNILVGSFSRANQSRERWEDGWRAIKGMRNGQIIARKGIVIRKLTPGEFVNPSGSGRAHATGTSLRVFVPRESTTMQAGYYFAFGETLADSSDEYSIGRFYWHISTAGAALLLELVTRQLNLWQIPFHFKTGMHPEMHSRADSAVLYVPRRTVAFTQELLMDIHSHVRDYLQSNVPLFTLRLADGLAFAEDPGTRESFGMSRSRILAQGIWMAHREGATNPEDRLGFVEKQFEAEGVSIEQPWLNPGSSGRELPAALQGEVI